MAFLLSPCAPAAGMDGGCQDFAIPMKNEMALWDAKELRIQGAQDIQSTAVLPMDRKIDLTLHPEKSVQLAMKPEKDMKMSKNAADPKFAGLATIDVKRNGTYRISFGSRLWLDLIEPETGERAARVITSDRFDMQTGCEKIVKVVEYSLKANHKYFVQITAGPQKSARLAITQAK